jgi:uncharacterized phage protein (TIGR01671 family)
MNREIKFRLWDKIRKEMRKGCHNILIDSLDGKPYWQYGYDEAMPMVNYEVMQFTGLLDKNGKEIYEADLLKRLNGEVETVVFDSGCFCIKHKDGSFDFIAEHNQFEIVGNIYENIK